MRWKKDDVRVFRVDDVSLIEEGLVAEGWEQPRVERVEEGELFYTALAQEAGGFEQARERRIEEYAIPLAEVDRYIEVGLMADYIRASVAVGCDPLEHLKKRYGGQWKLLESGSCHDEVPRARFEFWLRPRGSRDYSLLQWSPAK